MWSQWFSLTKEMMMHRLNKSSGIFTKVDEDNKFSNVRLSLELIDSIKTISARIDEIRMIVKDSNDRRQSLVKRMERLVCTRMKLIYSFMDINPHFNTDKMNPFNSINISYKNFSNGFRR